MTDYCEACGDPVRTGRYLELEFPRNGEPVSVSARLCDGCATILADHWIVRLAEAKVREVVTDGGVEERDKERPNQLKELQKQSSMDHWWPRLEPLDVPTPDTVRVEIAETREFQGGLALPVPDESELHDAIGAVGGPPAFLRSDVTSRKHQMEASRIVDDEPLASVVAGVVEQHHLSMGMPMPSSWYVREWLKLYHEFKGWAYDHRDFPTPIAAELRFFLLDGEIHDHGFYWPKEAVRRPNREDWEPHWERTRETALNATRVNMAERYARKVATEFDTGYWSVDFALTESDQWYAIDMARGELSWHPEGIEQAVPDPRERSVGTDKSQDGDPS